MNGMLAYTFTDVLVLPGALTTRLKGVVYRTPPETPAVMCDTPALGLPSPSPLTLPSAAVQAGFTPPIVTPPAPAVMVNDCAAAAAGRHTLNTAAIASVAPPGINEERAPATPPAPLSCDRM